MFQNWLDLTMKTASSNSLWAYIREGLLVEGYLRLRFGGAYFREGLFFLGGGAYYRNFTVFCFFFFSCRLKLKTCIRQEKAQGNQHLQSYWLLILHSNGALETYSPKSKSACSNININTFC